MICKTQTRCEYTQSDCNKSAKFQCEVWLSDKAAASGFEPVNRALCEEHADCFMRANMHLGVYARKMKYQPGELLEDKE